MRPTFRRIAAALLARTAPAMLAALLPLAAVADAPERSPLPVVRHAAVPSAAVEADGQALRAALGLSGHSGWVLTDLDTGELLDAHAAEMSFAPASVAKLPTALFALETLGADHRFETLLRATGPVRAGTLEGDLVLEGGGDPELDTDALARFVAALREAGVRRVAGRFLVDGRAVLQAPEIDPLQPIDMAYNPSVSALNLNFNRVFVRWGRQAGPGGLSVTAKAERLDPPVDAVRVERAAAAEPPFRHAVSEDGETWSLAGAMLRGEGARWLPVRRPELYAGDVLRLLARAEGIEIARPETGHAASPAWVLARLLSRPLGAILADMLRHSTNLTAEVVGAAAARAAGHAPETLAQSAAMMNAWIARAGGYSPGDPRIRFVNHSGLSTESRVAPSRLAGLLAAAARAVPAGLDAHPLLPGPAAALLRDYSVASEEDAPGERQAVVRAKTGTMDRIRGLAGYIVTPRGRRLAFAILSNALAERESGARAISPGWMNRARGFERALIRAWVRRFDTPAGGAAELETATAAAR